MREQNKHLSAEALINLVEEANPSDGAPTVAAHLADCSQCSSQFGRLRRLVGLMRADNSEDAPPDLLAGVVKQFRVRRAQEAGGSSRLSLRRVIAALTFDSLGMNPAMGVRSGEDVTTSRGGAGRQMLYSAEDYDLDLRIVSSGDKWLLSGQLLGENCGDGQVELISGTAEILSLPLNELCEFSLPPVEGGEYLLRLTAPNLEIEVPSLRVGR